MEPQIRGNYCASEQKQKWIMRQFIDFLALLLSMGVRGNGVECEGK